MNLNIPELEHSFSLITAQGITRTRRSKLVEQLLTQLQLFSNQLAKRPVGTIEVVDTAPCRVTFEVKENNVVQITFKGDEETVEPVTISTKESTLMFNGFPSDNNTVGMVIASLLIKNTIC